MITFIEQRNKLNSYLVNKRLYLAILLFILMSCSSLFAQVFDMEQLEELRELRELQELEEEKAKTPFLIEDEATKKRGERKKGKELLENEAENFGYTGRRDFIISPQAKTLNKYLKYFGYDYFNDVPTTFAAVTDIPIPPDYILGPGDEIRIILFGNTNKTYARKVTREGEIFFPEIGPISVVGLTFKDLKETIQQIVDKQIVGGTKVSLTLGVLRSINIFVLGEASQPGMYTLSSLSTLTNAIFTSGGIKTTGSLRNIEVKRNGKVLSTFDFYNLLLNGDTSDDVRLISGDVVFIPPTTKTIGIAGEVARPGIYELVEGETAEDLISYAGKLKPKADLTSIEIQSVDPMGDGFRLTHLDLNQSLFSDVHLNDGDILTIYPVVNRMGKSILLSGHTQKPGFHPWRAGMKMLDLLIAAEDLLPMTDMNYVLIKRENTNNQLYQILQVDLEELFSMPNSDQNIFLEERDEIIFFPAWLTPDLINVKLIEGEYNNGDEQQALIYTRKSFKKSFKTTDEELLTTDKEMYKGEDKFFQYTIHDYCTLPEPLIENLLGIDAEGIDPNAEKILTQYCRRQLVNPVITLLERQDTGKEKQQVFDIFGNVAFEGRYPLPKKETLKEALKASGGLKYNSYTAEIEISRKNVIGKETFITNSIISFGPDTESLLLEPLDTITIKQLYDTTNSVEVRGEVFFPGRYQVSPNETISNLIKRAGGLKDEASLKGTVFQREFLKVAEQERLKEMQSELRKNLSFAMQTPQTGQTSTMNMEALSLFFDEEINEKAVIGRLIIDLKSILEGTATNVILENGDVITIPKSRQIVSVIGEVYVPNSHIFEENFTIKDYITMSGGPTKYADIDNNYIIRTDGSVVASQGSNSRFFRSTVSNELEAGDTIVIPVTIDQFSALKATADITQIIYQMALATAAVNSF